MLLRLRVNSDPSGFFQDLQQFLSIAEQELFYLIGMQVCLEHNILLTQSSFKDCAVCS